MIIFIIIFVIWNTIITYYIIQIVWKPEKVFIPMIKFERDGIFFYIAFNECRKGMRIIKWPWYKEDSNKFISHFKGKI